MIDALLDRQEDALAHEAAEVIEAQQTDTYGRIEHLVEEIERLRGNLVVQLDAAFRAGWDFRDSKSVPAQQLNNIQDETYRELVDVHGMLDDGFAEYIESLPMPNGH